MYLEATNLFPLQVPADVEKCQDRVECFNADLKADMERWQSNKRHDFRQLLVGLADKNIQYYEKVRSSPCHCVSRGLSWGWWVFQKPQSMTPLSHP